MKTELNLTAERARQLSEKGRLIEEKRIEDNRMNKIIEVVLRIRAAADRGLRHITVGCMYGDVIEHFEEMGYEVKDDVHCPGSKIISW